MCPFKPLRPCNHSGCPTLSDSGYCDAHKRHAFRSRFANKELSSHQRGYGAAWRRLREVVLSEEPVCRICGERASVICDHITPKAEGGTDDRGNLEGVCRPCSDAKTAREAQRGVRRWNR